MKKKISNRLISEVCRESLNKLLKETEEFNNNQISIETLLQCMFQAIEEDGFYSENASVYGNIIRIDDDDSTYGCQLGVAYDGDLGYFEFDFDVDYSMNFEYDGGGGDGYWEPRTYPSYEISSVDEFRISPIKVTGDVNLEIPMNSELCKQIEDTIDFELTPDYEETLLDRYSTPWD